MKTIRKITALIILVLVNSCSQDEPTTPPDTKSNEANLLKLELEHEGTTYTTSISGTSITLSNILPYGTAEVNIKTIEISDKAIANKKVGDKLNISDNPISIEVTAENGCINYDLHQDHKNENTFLFYENWESRSHWEDHNVSVHIKAFQQATEGMIEKVEIFEMHKID